MTGSTMFWKSSSLSDGSSTCPSYNGHRILVGCWDGSVRMWNLDLENLVIDQAGTTDTRDDFDVRRVTRISPPGKMAVTGSQQSSKVEFLDTTTGEVVARMDIEYKDDLEIAFFPRWRTSSIFVPTSHHYMGYNAPGEVHLIRLAEKRCLELEGRLPSVQRLGYMRRLT